MWWLSMCKTMKKYNSVCIILKSQGMLQIVVLVVVLDQAGMVSLTGKPSSWIKQVPLLNLP
jgi:hypothetical protein